MQPVVVSLVGFLFAAGGVLFLVFGLRASSVTEEAARLHDFVSESAWQAVAQVQAMSFRKAELSGSFHSRLFLPTFKRLGQLFGRMAPARQVDELRRQLAIAGNPLGLGPREFYGIRFIFALMGIAVIFLILRGNLSRPAQPTLRQPVPVTRLETNSPRSAMSTSFPSLVGGVLILYIGLYLPKRWLRGRVRARQTKIRKALPDALDMLSVCADAGLGFDQALQRVSERWKSPLAVEFSRVVSEMQMGVSRQRALRNLAERIDVPELSSFVAVIVQSDQLGMSIVQTLRSQAEQMRVERRHRAQEEARKAPLKMLFPMLLLIFPAMLAVIIGPSVPVFIEVFGTIRSVIGP